MVLGQVNHHLVRGHPSPPPHRIRADPIDPCGQFGQDIRIRDAPLPSPASSCHRHPGKVDERRATRLALPYPALPRRLNRYGNTNRYSPEKSSSASGAKGE